jgi:hypothetical protein
MRRQLRLGKGSKGSSWKLTRQRGLGDVGSDDDLPSPVSSRLKDLRLQIGRHLRVNGQYGQRSRVVELRETFCDRPEKSSARWPFARSSFERSRKRRVPSTT